VDDRWRRHPGFAKTLQYRFNTSTLTRSPSLMIVGAQTIANASCGSPASIALQIAAGCSKYSNAISRLNGLVATRKFLSLKVCQFDESTKTLIMTSIIPDGMERLPSSSIKVDVLLLWYCISYELHVTTVLQVSTIVHEEQRSHPKTMSCKLLQTC